MCGGRERTVSGEEGHAVGAEELGEGEGDPPAGAALGSMASQLFNPPPKG